MSEFLEATVAWLSSTGAPNGLVLLAFLTHPSVWTDAALKRLRPVLDRIMPAKGEATSGAVDGDAAGDTENRADP